MSDWQLKWVGGQAQIMQPAVIVLHFVFASIFTNPEKCTGCGSNPPNNGSIAVFGAGSSSGSNTVFGADFSSGAELWAEGQKG
jgi:hypothetical protein